MYEEYPRAPRIVGVRPGFQSPEPTRAGGQILVALGVVLVLEAIALIGHALWVAQLWALHLVR